MSSGVSCIQRDNEINLVFECIGTETHGWKADCTVDIIEYGNKEPLDPVKR